MTSFMVSHGVVHDNVAVLNDFFFDLREQTLGKFHVARHRPN
jgi:hypothetical protein